MPRAAPTFQPMPPPMDVRMMNVVASTLFAAVGLGAALGGVLWLMKSPLFPIRSIQVDGELGRNSVPTIRANASPRLAGNFFSVDLQAARNAFEAVPWVRRAVVRRLWPDRLAVTLEEHRAAALWQGPADGLTDKLVNSHGEVFQANVGDVEDDSLPTFAGPDGSAAAMLAMYRRLQPVLAQLEMTIETLELSSRGSWRAELDNGASLELGRGSEDEVVARAERFQRTYTQVGARFGSRPLEYADLRHADGYAVRLRGVSTTTATPAKTR